MRDNFKCFSVLFRSTHVRFEDDLDKYFGIVFVAENRWGFLVPWT